MDFSFSLDLSVFPSSVRLEILAPEICLLIFTGFWRGRTAFSPNPFWDNASICIYNGDRSGQWRAWDPLSSFYSRPHACCSWPLLLCSPEVGQGQFLPWVGADGSDLAVSWTSEALFVSHQLSADVVSSDWRPQPQCFPIHCCLMVFSCSVLQETPSLLPLRDNQGSLPALLFSCQSGVGRTNLGMVLGTLVMFHYRRITSQLE